MGESRGMTFPFLIFTGSLESHDTIYLAADKHIICDFETSLVESALALLATYYVFRYNYPPELTIFFLFAKMYFAYSKLPFPYSPMIFPPHTCYLALVRVVKNKKIIGLYGNGNFIGIEDFCLWRVIKLWSDVRLRRWRVCSLRFAWECINEYGFHYIGSG